MTITTGPISTAGDWPCDALAPNPPSVVDGLANTTADRLVGAVLAVTPRGAAWGTDEAGDGSGASATFRGFWRAIAGVVSDAYNAAFIAASQCFPSAISYSLADWERELGLPDDCASGIGGDDARIGAVRAKWRSTGGASPAYFICVARAAGYSIAIDEPTPFRCSRSPCGEGPDQLGGNLLRTFWIVRVLGTSAIRFRAGQSRAAVDPLLRIARADDLECLLRRLSPMHTKLLFHYGD